MSALKVSLAVSLAASTLAGSPIETAVVPELVPPTSARSWCASGPAIVEHLERLHEWNERRRPLIRTLVDRPFLEVDGIYFYEADESLIPQRKQMDLEGSTLRLEPVEGGGWSVEKTELSYRFSRGELIHDDGEWVEAEISTGGTPIVVGQAESSLLKISNTHGVWFDEPFESRADQLLGSDVMGLGAVVSPLLISSTPATWESPDLWVDYEGGTLVVTWLNDRDTEFTYDIQAVFHPDGAIDFNYRSIGDANWGTVVVSDGAYSHGDLRTIFSVEDELDEAPADANLQSFKVEQAGSSEMVRITIEMAEALDRATMESDDWRWIAVSIDNWRERVEVYLTPEETWYRVPGRPWREGASALEIDENVITVWVDASELDGGAVTGVYSHAHDQGEVDRISGDSLGRLDPVILRRAARDLSEMSSSSTDIVLESFTLGDLDVQAVWEEVAARSNFDAEQVDALAVYQNFFTDIVLYAGAYSTGGNPQVSGVFGHGRMRNPGDPASPALMHMNRLRYRHNENDPKQGRVLAHEVGHRWLYFFEIMENGERSSSLNPLGAHPAEYVHIPAAFPVYGGDESSVMGGAYFTDNFDGTWTAPTELDSFGFSWHELYLMGLAAPEEVEPWYYLADTEPELGPVYYPPLGITVEGERVDVHFDQLVAAMGPREPDHTRSKRQFQLLYVLVVDDLDAVTEEDVELMKRYRENFRETFARATGGRASVVGNEPAERRRAARR